MNLYFIFWKYNNHFDYHLVDLTMMIIFKNQNYIIILSLALPEFLGNFNSIFPFSYVFVYKFI